MFYSGTPFFMIPTFAIYTPTFEWLYVKTGAGRLLMVLMDKSTKSPKSTFPKCVDLLTREGKVCVEFSYGALAAYCKCERRTIISWIDEFEARGLIRKIPQRERERNIFQVGYVTEQGHIAYFANDMFYRESKAAEEALFDGDPEITPPGDPQITTPSDPEITSPSDLEITQEHDGKITPEGNAPHGNRAVQANHPGVVLMGQRPTLESKDAGGRKKSWSKDQRGGDQAKDTIAGMPKGSGGSSFIQAAPSGGREVDLSRSVRAKKNVEMVISYFQEQHKGVLDAAYVVTPRDTENVTKKVVALDVDLNMDAVKRMIDFMLRHSNQVDRFKANPELFRIFHDNWFSRLYTLACSDKLETLLPAPSVHSTLDEEGKAAQRKAFEHLKGW